MKTLRDFIKSRGLEFKLNNYMNEILEDFWHFIQAEIDQLIEERKQQTKEEE